MIDEEQILHDLLHQYIQSYPRKTAQIGSCNPYMSFG
jgi:hypothetical protein